MQSSQSSKGAAPRRTMSLTRRLTGSIRLPHPARRQRPASMIATTDHDHDHLYEFRRPSIYDSEERESRAERVTVPRQGYQVQFVGFRELAARLEKRREAKEEGKREERREWLRGKIGPVEKDG